MEHAVSEMAFVDKSQCGGAGQTVCQQAISTVKALKIAAEEGQRIYTVTQANVATVLPKISASDKVIEDIQDAVAAGKEVTIHEKPINAFGWQGTGYAVIDPQTGAGAYLIDGEANGSFLVIMGASLMAVGIIGTFGLAIPGLAISALAIYIAVWALMIGLIIVLQGMLAEGTDEAKWDEVKGPLMGLVTAVVSVFAPEAGVVAKGRDIAAAIAGLIAAIVAVLT
jgi:hypothetical protein